MAAHRLQRHLGAQLGRVGDVEERVLLADGAIFGKRPARLAHEPHRRPLDFLAPGGAHEKRLAHPARVAPIVNRVGEHPVAAGPLAPRWLAWSLEPPRAGVDRRRARDRARERGHGDLALARRRRRAGVVPLARPARQPDRLGRAPDAARRTPSRPGEQIELELAVTAPRPPGALPARVRPRRGASVLVRRGRLHAARASSSTSRRGSTRATLAVADPRRRRIPPRRAALAAQDEPLAGRTRAAAVAHLVAGAIPPPGWSRLAPRRARRGLGGGRDGGRARPAATATLEPVARRRRPQPALRPAAAAARRCSTASSRPSTSGCRPTPGDDGLFDGRVAVTLPRRSGRRPR